MKSFPNACLLLSGPKVAKPLVQVPGTGIQATPSNTSFEGQGRHTGPVYLETHGRAVTHAHSLGGPDH